MSFFYSLVFGLMILSMSACKSVNNTTSGTMNAEDNSGLSNKTLSVVSCSTPKEITGWDGSETNAKLRFTAYVKSDTELLKAEVKGAYLSDSRDIIADENYKPDSPTYKSYTGLLI